MAKSRKKNAVAASTKSSAEPKAVVDISTLEEKLGFRIRMAERAIYKSFVQKVGMTPVQYSVFILVADNEGMPQGAIGEALNLDRASTMAIMDKLESLELIERRKSPVDRRRYAMYLTAYGRKQKAAIEKKVRASDGQFKQELTSKQLQELIKCLNLISGL